MLWHLWGLKGGDQQRFAELGATNQNCKLKKNEKKQV